MFNAQSASKDRLIGLVVKAAASRATDQVCLFFGFLFVVAVFFFFLVFLLVFFFCVPQLYLWGSPLLGEIFAYVTFFLNPTSKVVTFSLRGWCVLGVFLLPAFTRLGHERQDLLSPCDEMHVCTD